MIAVEIIAIIITILLAVTLHEAMHAFAGYWLGDDTARLHGRLTLNPIAHLDMFGSILLPGFLILLNLTGVPTPIFGAAKPVPFNPSRVRFGEWGAALVALAGPLTNLAFAAIAGLSLRFADLPTDTMAYSALALFVAINLGFFIFNLIPFPPLDGSRVLYAFSPQPLRELMTRIESSGGVLMIFVLILFFSNGIGVFIGNGIEFFFNLFVGSGSGVI